MSYASAIIIAPSSMILWPHQYVVSIKTVRFLRLENLLIFPPPQWNKAELKVPEDRVGIHWRTDSGDVSVLLCSLADVDKILSKDLPHLVMRGYFYSIYLYCILFHLILLPPILTDNEALSLHDHSHVDTWWGVRVMSVDVIFTSGIGNTYHLPTLIILQYAWNLGFP